MRQTHTMQCRPSSFARSPHAIDAWAQHCLTGVVKTRGKTSDTRSAYRRSKHAKDMKDPAYRAKRLAALAKRNSSRRSRYAHDPAYRDKLRQESSARYASEKERIAERTAIRYWTDPEFRDRRRSASSKSYQHTMSDSTRRDKKRQRQRAGNVRKRLIRKLKP